MAAIEMINGINSKSYGEFNIKMPRIGKRNLKTALAVFLCVIISDRLKLEYPFFVAIAAIISLENSLMNSFKAGKNRMLGTIIGAGFGLAGALIQPENALTCGLGMIGVIYCCNLLKWRKPVAFAGVVFMAVISLKGKNPFSYSINRILDTFIGIIVAMAVNYFVFPPDYLPEISRTIPDLLSKTGQIITDLLLKKKISLVEYEKELTDINELLKLTCEDNRIRLRKKNAALIAGIENEVKILNQIRDHLEIICPMNCQSSLKQFNAQEIQDIWKQGSLPDQDTPATESDIVFNYHVQKILALYQRMVVPQ
jgi:Predicted membrane protein